MSEKSTNYIKGRGAQFNPNNPFNKWMQDEHLVLSGETKYIPTHAKTLVNKVESPDIPMPYSMNPYQGCEHGCVYCYARNTHPYWGYSAGLDFEQKILVKHEAPGLLRKFLNNKNYQCQPIMLSGNTDCYQPAEREFKLTRQLIELCLDYKQPISIITKNALVARDIDLLEALAAQGLAQVLISITTLDEGIRSLLEPRTSTISKRLQTVSLLAEHNIPVCVMMAPVIPGLTHHEIIPMVKMCKERGAHDFYYTVLRLNGDVELIFNDWIKKTFPDRADKILNQTAACHGGSVQDKRFGTRMKGEGVLALNIKNQAKLAKKKYGLPSRAYAGLDCTRFQRPGAQLSLF